MRSILLACAIFLVVAGAALARVAGSGGVPTEGGEMLGRTGRPLGTTVTLQGVVVAGPHKGYEDGPNLLVQRIDGVATQELIRIPLRPEEGSEGAFDAVFREGASVEIEGYEARQALGAPEAAGEIAQGAGPGSVERLVILLARGIPEIRFGPGDFAGREALIEGRAASDGGRWLEGDGWRLHVGAGAWPAWMEGKIAEVYGRISAEGGGYRVEGGEPRLVALADQVGRAVALRGRAISLNGAWWFLYRDQELYIDGQAEREACACHGCALEVRGTLSEEPRPDLAQIAIVREPGKKPYFVVKDAECRGVEALLSPERTRLD